MNSAATKIFEVDCGSSIEEMFPLVCDSDSFNRRLKLPPLELLEPDAVQLEVTDKDVVLGYARVRMSRFINLVWAELASEWIPMRDERSYSLKRLFARETSIGWHSLEAKASVTPWKKGCRISYRLSIKPMSFLGGVLARVVVTDAAKTFAAMFRLYDETLLSDGTLSSLDEPRFPPSSEERFEERIFLFQKEVENRFDEVPLLEWASKTYDLPNVFKRLLHTLPDSEVLKVCPLSLQKHWKESPKPEILAELLNIGSYVGLFQRQFRSVCPYCQGTREISDRIDKILPTVRCDPCGITLAEKEKLLRVTYRADSELREAKEVPFCLGSPGNPGWMARFLVPPGERMVQLDLPTGKYFLRRRGSREILKFAVLLPAKSHHKIVLGDRTTMPPEMNEGSWLTFQNRAVRPELVTIERVTDKETFTTDEYFQTKTHPLLEEQQ